MKAQGQRDVANAQPPGCLLLCACLSRSCICSQRSPKPCSRGRATAAGLGAAAAPAGNSCQLGDPSLAGTGSGTEHTSTAGLPGSPRGTRVKPWPFGEKAFFFVLFCFPASGTAQPAPASGCAVAWHSQLSRQCHCTGKGLGPVPKCPSALGRAVRLETSTSSARPPVWGLPCVSVCSRNGKLSAALVGLSPHSLPLTVLALLSQKHNPADVGYPPLPLVLLFSSAASLLIASALALSTDPKEPECPPLGSGKGFGCG